MDNALEEHKVSVIIPAYNRARFISMAVESVIRQNYSNLEIIIVDDGSDDNTEEVIASLKLKYPNIIYCQNERLKGPSGARNTGILKSSGYYLSFLDSDDEWLDNHLSDGLNTLNNHPDIDVFFGNFSVVDYDTGTHQYDFFDKKNLLHTLASERLSPRVKVLHDNVLLALLQEGFFHLGSTILRKSILGDILFDEAIMFTEDRDFAIRLYKEASATFAFCEDPVFSLHIHNSNLYNNGETDRWGKTLETHLYLFTKYFKNYALTCSEKKILSDIISRKFLNLSYIYAKNYQLKSLFPCVLKGIQFRLCNLKESILCARL